LRVWRVAARMRHAGGAPDVPALLLTVYTRAVEGVPDLPLEPRLGGQAQVCELQGGHQQVRSAGVLARASGAQRLDAAAGACCWCVHSVLPVCMCAVSSCR
jgi:hypothetical protein